MSTSRTPIEAVLEAQTVLWVEAALGENARLLSAQQMPGATSSTLYRLDVRQAGKNFPLVLRRYTNAAWLAEEPSVPQHEAAALQYAGLSGAPVPELVAFDENGAAGAAPALLMTCLPGQVSLAPQDFDGWLRAMAEALLPIHALPGDAFPYAYWHYYDLQKLQPPAWSAQPHLWERAIDLLHQGPPAHQVVFIHRDYHPVNVLWVGEHLSGIVDWANACHGSPNHDIAHCRLNLASMYDTGAADRFLWHCKEVFGPGFEHPPYWDINAAAEWDLESPPQVYPPWVEFGLTGLTQEILKLRMETYIASLIHQG